MQYTFFSWSTITWFIGLILAKKSLPKFPVCFYILCIIGIFMTRIPMVECRCLDGKQQENFLRSEKDVGTNKLVFSFTFPEKGFSSNDLSSKNQSINEKSVALYIQDLNQQERHLRVKKAIQKEKPMSKTEMKKKLQQLMTNITEMLSDMDSYFSLSQSSTTEASELRGSGRFKKKMGAIKKDPNVNNEEGHSFIDSFIAQMFEINPSVLEKLRSRIDEEVSLSNQHNKLVRPSRQLDREPEEDFTSGKLFGSTETQLQELKVKTVLLKPNIPDYDGNEDETLDFSGQYLQKCSQSSRVPSNNTCNIITSSSTTSGTTFETFYDYGDYYKENENDDAINILEYDINKCDDSSTEGNEGYYLMSPGGPSNRKNTKLGIADGSDQKVKQRRKFGKSKAKKGNNYIL